MVIGARGLQYVVLFCTVFVIHMKYHSARNRSIDTAIYFMCKYNNLCKHFYFYYLVFVIEYEENFKCGKISRARVLL